MSVPSFQSLFDKFNEFGNIYHWYGFSLTTIS
jgi:hypothetical protein